MGNKVYNGVVPLGEALNSVSIGSSKGKPSAPKSSYVTIKEQEYRKVCGWMRKYSSRLAVDKSGKVEIKEKPVFGTLEELRKDLGMTWGHLKAVAKSNGDAGAAFNYETSISEEKKKDLLENFGLSTDVTYVALKSQYPFLSKVFQK